MPKSIRVLFVCGRNNRRSPTAERVFLHDPRMRARAVGIADTSKRRITEDDLRWADLVLAMERKHVRRLQAAFGHLDELPPIENLDISDEYIFMQRELVELLQENVAAALEAYHLEQAAAEEESSGL